jgi:5'-methylthioadenosine phosphorylase
MGCRGVPPPAPEYDASTMRMPLKIGIIGGTGLGEALTLEGGEPIEVDTPFGPPSAPIVQTQWEGVDIAILHRHGAGHVFNPSTVPYRANLFALKSLGVTHIVASGATGSLREDIHPGELVIVDQIIDKTHKRANTFFDYAAVHVEFAEPFCPVMRQWLLDASAAVDHTTVHDKGTYVCMEGPAFSTRAESHMHRAWGGDLIGMTAMPEARLAREAEIAYAMIAMPTDYDCWRPHDTHAQPQALLTEILGNLRKATEANLALIRQALCDVSTLRRTPSPAHQALKLGIWSNKSMIPRAEVERLAVLWGRYFE